MSTVPRLTEIFKLRDLLDEAGIEYVFSDRNDNWAVSSGIPNPIDKAYGGHEGKAEDYQILISHTNNKRDELSIISSFYTALNHGDTLEIAKLNGEKITPRCGLAAEECLDIIRDFLS